MPHLWSWRCVSDKDWWQITRDFAQELVSHYGVGLMWRSTRRTAKAMAECQGQEYVPVTERGTMVHAARQARAAFR